jgi:cobyrinic acid a,c-diamide synthase
MKPKFLIAAPFSNSGKTTVTLGLLRLFADRGFKVQPFKCGPDFLDPKHHAMAGRAESINLDTFMMSETHVKTLFYQYSEAADISIVEGMMGLFDGSVKMQGSSAEIALLLDLPVILVIDAKAMAYSAAALIHGFRSFVPQLKLTGVVFNFVNGPSHYRFLQEVCEEVGIEALGYLPEDDLIKIPSRHLGLSISPENNYESMIRRAAEMMQQYVRIVCFPSV